MSSGADRLALADLAHTVQAEMANHVLVYAHEQTPTRCRCGADVGEVSEPATPQDRSRMDHHRTEVAIRMASDRIADEIDKLVVLARRDGGPGEAMAEGRDMAARHARRYAEAVRSRG